MENNFDIRNMRVDYTKSSLNEKDILEDPIEQFRLWFDNAKKQGVKEPNMMSLATIRNNRPSIRIVLLKQILDNKFIFFTNYLSRKAMDIENNSHVCINFYWEECQQQVRIEGIAKKTSPAISDEYFAMRNRESQIGAWASKQSQPIKKEELESRVAIFSENFEERDVPRPPHWGGFEIDPKYMEFWQGGSNRLHDRIIYEKIDGSWKISRIAP